MSEEAHMSAICRNGSAALLRYCELDTMAMVCIWEYFNEAMDRLAAEMI